LKRLLLLLLVVFSLPAAAFAEDGKPLETVRYTLENGLQVVLAPDRRVPKVVMNLRYRVGSMNEPAGRSGFAHLFEHLMFSGTKAWPQIFDAQSAMGNTINAWTEEDGTTYYVEGLSSGLPTILAIEADRMANLGDNVDQRELDLQRNVVKNEMRQNVLDQAGAAGRNAFWSALFPKSHPYSRAVIGSIADLDDASLDDVRGFFNTYYVPNNAILALVGDFDVEAAKALVADTFGRVPRGKDVGRPAIPEPAPTRARIEVSDRVATPSVVIGFSGPAATAEENGDLSIASDILGNDAFGLLRTRLVSEKGVASAVGSYWTPGLLGGRFEISATANEGVSAETLEKELRAAFDEFLAGPVDAGDVARAKSLSLLSSKLSIEPFDNRTSAIAYASDILGDPDLALIDDPQIVAATAESVSKTARRLLVPADATTLITRPGARGNYPAILLESSGKPAPFEVAARPEVEIPKLPEGEPRPVPLPEKSTKTLSNGAKLIHYQLSESPMEYVAAIAEGGWDNAPEGKEGLIDIAGNMAVRGAGDRTYAELARTAADIGASLGYSSGSYGTAMALFVPKQDFAGGLSLLSDVLLRPRFDAGEWRIVMSNYQQWLVNRESNLPGLASRWADKVLFPKKPGKPDGDWSLEALNSMTIEEAKDTFRKLYQPSTTVFYSVGSQSIDEVAAGLEKTFAAWKDDQAGFKADAYPSPAFPEKRKVLLVPEPGASQSALYIGRPAPGRADPGRSEATAVMRLLGDDFNGRLNSVIREEKGYTYGVSARLMSGMKSNGGMVVEMTVERDNTGAALQEVFKGFGTLTTLPVSEQELNRTITAYTTAMAATTETGRGFAGYLIDTATLGIPLEDDHERRQRVANLKLEPVRLEAPKLASLDHALIVIAGDPDIVLPQLAAIGISDVEVVERNLPEAVRSRQLPMPETGEGAPAEGGAQMPAGPGSTRSSDGCDTSTGRNCPPAGAAN